ncbi:Nitrogen permease regulator 3 [Actinomortierella ambigua]|uniref:Nitrogen permease regulator 3 n=1 Tax=Actinomortierella ambigua TaxID=1343610 RepID=A0A9P6QJD8_9FUNG|nr:Nitrogen permease regulator 3 [Actinomortierella ambigua]
MHGLVSIVIVTNSSRGHHFVYKYPSEGKHRGTASQAATNGTTVGQAPFSRTAWDEAVAAAGSPTGKPRRIEDSDDFQQSTTVHGYDTQFLANLLSPKLALCDKRFQLTVEDLTFIGHPVSLMGTEFRQRREQIKWKMARPRKQPLRRGWVMPGATPMMESDSSSDDDDVDDEDEENASDKDDVNGTLARTQGSSAALAERDSLTPRGGATPRDESAVPSQRQQQHHQQSLENSVSSKLHSDPSGWRQRRFRTHTSTSNPGSPSASDGSLSNQSPAPFTPLLGSTAAFTPTLLHHPVSGAGTSTIPGTPTPRHMFPPPIQVSIANDQGTSISGGNVGPGGPSNASGTLGVGPPDYHSISTPAVVPFQQMSYFHVIFVLKPSDLELNDVADQVYKNIACKLTAALRYEELNNQYVSQEATKILAIREEATQTGMSLAQFHEQVLKTSSLARAVRSIYDNIVADKVCHIVLNDSIDLSLQIPTLTPLTRTNGQFARQWTGLGGPAESPSTLYAAGSSGALTVATPNGLYSHWPTYMLMDEYELGIVYEFENFPLLYPYHALLLLEDPEEILKDIPLDANPTLVKLVQILVPYQCLDELQYILDCSMAQVYRLAAHLIYWRKAKLIGQIRTNNVYAVSPKAEINRALLAEFSLHSPTVSLPSILHELSTPTMFKSIIPGGGKDKEAQTLYMEVLTFLLRKDLVVQMHTYVSVIVPEHIKMGISAEEYEQMREAENNAATTPTMDLTPGQHVPRGGQSSSVQSADHHLSRHQQEQQHLQQLTLPNQGIRHHHRSSTGPGQNGGNTQQQASQQQQQQQQQQLPSQTSAANTGMSSSLKSNHSLTPGSSKISGKRQDNSSLIPNPGQASELEQEWLVRMGENQPQSVADLFMRLVPYFDGRHHLEEITFREQIALKDLKTVMKAFNDYLITTWAYQ